ncbi:MAG: hypothetical protein JOZ75_12010 [Candidatus Dormibacteraeota bacterium]|nr:hypothetical protein [Candidatus Dormibacteraeota bacterium]
MSHRTWEMSSERPHRVTSIDIDVRLPAETPPERVAAVARAVGHCTVHNSMVQVPSITMAASIGEPARPRAA